MNTMKITLLEEVVGGALADDGAALAARGVDDIRYAKLWEGRWFVGTAELYLGAAQFYGGWAAETIGSTRYWGLFFSI